MPPPMASVLGKHPTQQHPVDPLPYTCGTAPATATVTKFTGAAADTEADTDVDAMGGSCPFVSPDATSSATSGIDGCMKMHAC